jgi:DNA-directed RNA polymerase subunit RPC12/RpoP
VEYGDYECPHCGRAYSIVKQIQERLGFACEPTSPVAFAVE